MTRAVSAFPISLPGGSGSGRVQSPRDRQRLDTPSNLPLKRSHKKTLFGKSLRHSPGFSRTAAPADKHNPMANPTPPPPKSRPTVSGAFHRLTTLASVVLLAGAGVLGYQLMRNGVAADVYHDRLVALNDDHNVLIEQYNQAVTRTAVTELLIENGTVCVNVRTADGQLETHPVDANPAHPIYVDYVVKDQRLLIRRVFDSKSVPDDAGVINSTLLNLDWTDPTVKHGQAIYRKLTDGRWIVTVSGDGSLSLSKVSQDTEVELLPAPTLREFDPVEATQEAIQQITPADVFGRFFGSGK